MIYIFQRFHTVSLFVGCKLMHGDVYWCYNVQSNIRVHWNTVLWCLCDLQEKEALLVFSSLCSVSTYWFPLTKYLSWLLLSAAEHQFHNPLKATTKKTANSPSTSKLSGRRRERREDCVTLSWPRVLVWPGPSVYMILNTNLISSWRTWWNETVCCRGYQEQGPATTHIYQ